MTNRPLVAVAPRWEERKAPAHFADTLAPFEGSAHDFVDSLTSFGAMPVTVPMTENEDLVDGYVDLCAGLAIPGGPDVNPKLWGDDRPYDAELLCDCRDRLELALIKKFRAAHKPIFTTCRGTQILNVAYGGTLDMAIERRTPRPGTALWRHTGILSTPAHPVEVVPGTLLARCLGGVGLVQANSSHHCSVLELGDGLVQSAQATDGIPEAIEDPAEKFVLGVQWHPECTWRTVETDALLWRAFVGACR